MKSKRIGTQTISATKNHSGIRMARNIPDAGGVSAASKIAKRHRATSSFRAPYSVLLIPFPLYTPDFFQALRDRNGRLGSVCTAGDSLFQACANALDFFWDDFWKGSKPGPGTILEVCPVGDGSRYRVRVWRVMEWRRAKASATSSPGLTADQLL